MKTKLLTLIKSIGFLMAFGIFNTIYGQTACPTLCNPPCERVKIDLRACNFSVAGLTLSWSTPCGNVFAIALNPALMTCQSPVAPCYCYTIEAPCLKCGDNATCACPTGLILGNGTSTPPIITGGILYPPQTGIFLATNPLTLNVYDPVTGANFNIIMGYDACGFWTLRFC